MTQRASTISAWLIAGTLCALSSLSYGEQVQTEAEMNTFLSDSLVIEDFEGISVHGGSLIPMPNPLDADNAPFGMTMQPGVIYLANTELNIFGGFINGEEDVFLRGGSLLTLTFDSPQAGVGVHLIGASTQFTYQFTITFMSEAEALGSLGYSIPGRGSEFAGWADTVTGITSIEITAVSGSSIPSAIDNIMFGAVLNTACPSDLNFDGSIDTADLGLLLSSFGTNNPTTDINNDGIVDTADLGILLAAFDSNCP